MRAAILAVVLGMCGCAGDGSGPGDGDGDGDVETERNLERLDDTLAEVETDCGDLVFDYSDCPTPTATEAIDCFESSERPYIKQTLSTIEGDPIIQHFLIEDGSPVLYSDHRADAFGSPVVTRGGCSPVLNDGVFPPDCVYIVCGE